jgi:hypothetical protein
VQRQRAKVKEPPAMRRKGSHKGSMPNPAAAVQGLWGALPLLLVLTFCAGVHAVDGNPEGTTLYMFP